MWRRDSRSRCSFQTAPSARRWKEERSDNDIQGSVRNSSEARGQDLLRVVTESVSAYKVCRERIDAVEKALQAALGADGAAPLPT